MLDKENIEQLLITDVFPWIYEQIKTIKQHGKNLSEQEKYVAKLAGIENIDDVKVFYTKLDFPFMDELNQILQNKKTFIKLNALALGHYIIIDNDAKEDTLIHELRHVAQSEMFDNVEDFIEFYVRELFKFGYGNGPFENDASSFTLVTKLKLRKNIGE